MAFTRNKSARFIIAIHLATFYLLSITTTFSAISFMLGFQCDYTISHKSDSFNIHKHHSDHTFKTLVYSILSSILVCVLSAISALFVTCTGLVEFTANGFDKYQRSYALAFSISLAVCVILSTAIGLVIGTEI